MSLNSVWNYSFMFIVSSTLVACGDGSSQNSFLSDQASVSSCISSSCGSTAPTTSKIELTFAGSSQINVPLSATPIKIDVGGECNDGNYVANRIHVDFLNSAGAVDVNVDKSTVPDIRFLVGQNALVRSDDSFVFEPFKFCVDGRWSAVIDLGTAANGAITTILPTANSMRKIRFTLEAYDNSKAVLNVGKFVNPNNGIGGKVITLNRIDPGPAKTN